MIKQKQRTTVHCLVFRQRLNGRTVAAGGGLNGLTVAAGGGLCR